VWAVERTLPVIEPWTSNLQPNTLFHLLVNVLSHNMRFFLLLILQPFDCLADFRLDLLQAILLIAV
jgi:hypothetical protein